MKIITRTEAATSGLKRYYTGKSCKHGHDSERWVHNRDSKPFQANKQAECDYMFSALRRMDLRGHLKEVYDGVIVNRAAEGANQ